MITRADIEKRVLPELQPLVNALRDELHALIANEVERVVESARASAIAGVKAQLDEKPAPTPVKKRALKKPRRKPAEVVEEDEPTDPAPAKKRAQMKCGNCGALGYRADGCGRTHNVLTEPATSRQPPADATPPPASPAPSSIRTAPPPIDAARADRFARIEAAARARQGRP